MQPRPLDWKGKSVNGQTPTIIGSALVREPNPYRVGATFVNDSAQWMYLAKALLAAVNTGIPLAPNGGAYEINLSNPYYGPISVGCAVAAQILAWTEDE